MNSIPWLARLLVLIAACCFALGTGAQDVDDFFVGTARDSVWTGRVRGDDGQFHETQASAAFARDLRGELARIQVAIDVEHKLPEARKLLDDLAIRATRRGYEGRKDVLVEIALARANLFVALEQPADARKALTSVLVNQSIPPRSAKYELVQPTEKDQQEAALANADERLVARLAKLAPAQAPRASVDASDKIEDIVRAALDRGDEKLKTDLGDRAIPALEKFVLLGLDALPEQSKDPLWHYVRLNQGRAAEFINAHFDEGGPIWKARILRAMGEPSMLDRWIQNGPEPARPMYPQWTSVIEKLLREPTTASEALPFVSTYARHDALTPGLQQALSQILLGADAALGEKEMNLLVHGTGRESVEPVFAVGLRSPHAAVRASAAARLVEYSSAPALLAAAGSKDPAVRVQVANALSPRNVRSMDSFGNGGSKWEAPVIGANEERILEGLVADPDPEVRAAAAQAVSKLVKPLDARVYDIIARDPDSSVRTPLLWAESVPLEVRARLAVGLAADSDPRVLESFDNFVNTVVLRNERVTPIDPAYIPAIAARRKNPARPLQTMIGASPSPQTYWSLIRSKEGLKAVVHWAAEGHDTDLASIAESGIHDRVGKAMGNRDLGRKSVLPDSADVDVDTSDLLPLFETLPFRKNQLSQLGWALVRLDLDLSSAFLPYATDPAHDVRKRLDALNIAANGSDPSLGTALHALLADPAWKSTDPTYYLTAPAEIVAALPAESAKRTLDRVLANPSIADAFVAAVANGIVKSRDLDAPEAEALLQRCYDKLPSDTPSVLAALRVVARAPNQGGVDWLARAARDGGYYVLAFDLIGEGRDPRYLPLLQEALSPTFNFTNISRDAYQAAALNALTRYFDERAANLILEVAGQTSSADLRDKCFKALETIRKYQEEKGRLKDERITNEAWDKSVQDLVALLDDKSPAVRAQAVRGLGTLGARQEMPRVVRMLKDPDESVRKAADEALGVLNAPPK
jgi:HEAT repeat protein